MKQKFFLGLLLLAIGFGSCNLNELSDTKLAPISPEWALPLIDDTFKVEDIAFESFEDGELQIFDDGLYNFIYTNELVGPSLEEAIVIRDTTVTGSFRYPVELSTGQSITLPQQRIAVNLNNLVLRELLFKSGQLGVSVNLLDALGRSINANVVYRFDSIRNSNFALSISSQSGSKTTRDVTEYRFNNNGSRTATNFYVTPTITANQTIIPGLYIFQTELSFTDLKFSFADVIATNFVPLAPKTDYIILKLFLGRYEDDNNDIRFDDPKVRFVTANGFGGDPFNLRITNIRSLSANNSITTALTGARVSEVANKQSPTANINYGIPQVLMSGIASETLDRTNTDNIDQVYSSAPQSLGYFASAVTQNRTTRITGADTSRFRLRSYAEFTTDGVANSYSLSDTFDLDVLPKNNLDQTIEEASFKLVFSNQFPVNLVGNMYFLDSIGTVIDSLIVKETNGTFNKILATAAKSGGAPDYRVPPNAATRNERIISVTRTRYDNLQAKAKKFILIANLNSYSDPATPERPRVKIYSDYVIRLKVGISTKVTLKL